MGWRPGQGVGSRLTKKEKRKIKLRNEKLKMAQDNSEIIISNSEDSEDDSVNVTFAPDDYEPFRCKPKDNYFGIGYSGLDRRKILSGHINLFETPAFCVKDKNKKLSIRGQAFGVGAFEADDEDIYEREDMSRYDFALGPERKTKTRWSEDGPSSQIDCLEGFIRAKGKLESKKIFKPPELPKNFAPVHAVRKSRFYPPIIVTSRPLESSKRKELTAVDRARILEDPDNRSKKSEAPSNTSVASNIIVNTLNLYGKQQIEERKKLENQQTTSSSWLDKLNVHNFVKGGIVGTSKDDTGLKKPNDFQIPSSSSTQLNTTKLNDGDSSSKVDTKKLFLSNPDKQRRFEQYLIFLKNNETSKLESIQPLSMIDWEREQERTEFEQAAKLDYANNYMTNKFVNSISSTTDHIDPEKDIKQAVKMKMFGKLTREKIEWKPASIVCKRFNIPEPKVGCAQVATDKKTAKFSVFDSLDWCSSSKFTKATDAVDVQQIQQSSQKMEDLNEAVPTIESNDIPSQIQASEPISEKFRNFQTSYEKVFGKNLKSQVLKDMKNIEDNLKSTDIQAQNVEVDNNSNQETRSESTSMFKDKNDKEKNDLFKAIFLSSSEDSESDTEENVDSDAMKSVLIGKDPKEINVERNTSPPRGIFAKLDLDNLVTQTKCSNDRLEESTTTEVSKNDLPMTCELQCDLTDTACDTVEDASVAAIPPDIYGPTLPQRLLKQQNSETTDVDNSQLIKPVFHSIVISRTVDDPKLSGKWVEREKLEKRGKKSKKDKKHKHKEHKSPKHKKKSKKKEKRSKH